MRQTRDHILDSPIHPSAVDDTSLRPHSYIAIAIQQQILHPCTPFIEQCFQHHPPALATVSSHNLWVTIEFQYSRRSV